MVSTPEELRFDADKRFHFYRGNVEANGWWRVEGTQIFLTIRDVSGVDVVDIRNHYDLYSAAKPQQRRFLPKWWVSQYLGLRLLERADRLSLYADGKNLYEPYSTTAPDGSKLSGDAVWRRAAD